jgi:acyl-homoserine-lactone acylase
MKSVNRLLVILAAAVATFAFQATRDPDAARWEQEARSVTIVRDDFGIAHVYGKTDADAVFGMEYAQAEDDFNRVETNYINAMGRLAETEGESKIYQDLRMKIFIEPGAMKLQYESSPEWLKKLMTFRGWPELLPC